MKSVGYALKPREYIGSVAPPSTVFYDESRFGNDGTITVITYSRLPSGLWVMVFGSNAYVELTSPSGMDFEVKDSFAAEAWVKITDVSDYRTVMQRNYYTAAAPCWTLMIATSTGKIYFTIRDGTNSVVINGNTDLSDGIWHHILGVRDTVEDKIYAYLDGAPDATPVTDTTTGAVGNTGTFRIGERIDNTYDFYSTMAKPRLHKRAPDAGEVKQRFESTRHWFGV